MRSASLVASVLKIALKAELGIRLLLKFQITPHQLLRLFFVEPTGFLLVCDSHGQSIQLRVMRLSVSTGAVTTMPKNRREPDGSVNMPDMLDVAMRDAVRGKSFTSLT